MPRYGNEQTFRNSLEFYEFLRKKRNDVKAIRQYDTPVLRNPTIADRARLKTNNHIWKYGDRYYKLADQYYNAVEYWWVIAWFNARPTEADISTGDVIQIPVDLQEALRVLGSNQINVWLPPRQV